ncbi:MAG: hypothetical protein JO100_14955 [Pseudonocardia sp.]|nr:hypothetical protein [Pseudonocardia sp.]
MVSRWGAGGAGLVAMTAAVGLVLSGCTSEESPSTAPPTPDYLSPNATVPPVTSDRVSANAASLDEIRQAFTQAGIADPNRWAQAVLDYRPYPADDSNLTKLRQNLAKYNVSPDTVDKMVSVLKP